MCVHVSVQGRGNKSVCICTDESHKDNTGQQKQVTESRHTIVLQKLDNSQKQAKQYIFSEMHTHVIKTL